MDRSLKAMRKGAGDRYGQFSSGKLVPEGVEARVPYKGKLTDVVFQLMGGLRSGMGYVGARNLDPPEEEFIRSSGLHTGEEGIPRALDGAGYTYVALDCDVLEATQISAFMPEPGGLSRADVERIFRDLRGRTKLLGAGFSGATFEPANVEPLTGFLRALGL